MGNLSYRKLAHSTSKVKKDFHMAVAIVIVLLTLGSVVFHVYSVYGGMWFTPLASNWGSMDDTLIITFWITGVVTVIIGLFMGYCIWKFRHREGHKAVYEPENKKLEIWLSVVTSIGVVFMLTPGLITWVDFVTVPEDAHEVEVLGRQWEWHYRMPGADGKLGVTSIQYMTDENLFGIDPNDPNSADDLLVEYDTLHLPIDKPVKLLLRSTDVLHDFYVPNFRAKMDLVPGIVSFMWLTPTLIGEYDVMCAEYCGLAHHAMMSRVSVDSAEDYDAWLAEQITFAELMEEYAESAPVADGHEMAAVY